MFILATKFRVVKFVQIAIYMTGKNVTVSSALFRIISFKLPHSLF